MWVRQYLVDYYLLDLNRYSAKFPIIRMHTIFRRKNSHFLKAMLRGKNSMFNLFSEIKVSKVIKNLATQAVYILIYIL